MARYDFDMIKCVFHTVDPTFMEEYNQTVYFLDYREIVELLEEETSFGNVTTIIHQEMISANDYPYDIEVWAYQRGYEISNTIKKRG